MAGSALQKQTVQKTAGTGLRLIREAGQQPKQRFFKFFSGSAVILRSCALQLRQQFPGTGGFFRRGGRLLCSGKLVCFLAERGFQFFNGFLMGSRGLFCGQSKKRIYKMEYKFREIFWSQWKR